MLHSLRGYSGTTELEKDIGLQESGTRTAGPTLTYRLHDAEEFASFGPRVGNGPSANDNFQTTTSFEVGCMTA